MRNIASDPRISVGVFAPLVGQASSRQLFGLSLRCSPVATRDSTTTGHPTDGSLITWSDREALMNLQLDR